MIPEIVINFFQCFFDTIIINGNVNNTIYTPLFLKNITSKDISVIPLIIVDTFFLHIYFNTNANMLAIANI